MREAEPRRASVEDAVVSSETALASLKADRAQIEAILGPEDARSAREKDLSDKLDDLGRIFAEADAHALRAAAVYCGICRGRVEARPLG